MAARLHQSIRVAARSTSQDYPGLGRLPRRRRLPPAEGIDSDSLIAAFSRRESSFETATLVALAAAGSSTDPHQQCRGCDARGQANQDPAEAGQSDAEAGQDAAGSRSRRQIPRRCTATSSATSTFRPQPAPWRSSPTTSRQPGKRSTPPESPVRLSPRWQRRLRMITAACSDAGIHASDWIGPAQLDCVRQSHELPLRHLTGCESERSNANGPSARLSVSGPTPEEIANLVEWASDRAFER